MNDSVPGAAPMPSSAQPKPRRRRPVNKPAPKRAPWLSLEDVWLFVTIALPLALLMEYFFPLR